MTYKWHFVIRKDLPKPPNIKNRKDIDYSHYFRNETETRRREMTSSRSHCLWTTFQGRAPGYQWLLRSSCILSMLDSLAMLARSLVNVEFQAARLPAGGDMLKQGILFVCCNLFYLHLLHDSWTMKENRYSEVRARWTIRSHFFNPNSSSWRDSHIYGIYHFLACTVVLYYFV